MMSMGMHENGVGCIVSFPIEGERSISCLQEENNQQFEREEFEMEVN